jgi:hypothetical protein
MKKGEREKNESKKLPFRSEEKGFPPDLIYLSVGADY